MMLPWGEMMRAAIARGLTPEAFWVLSMREWRWLAEHSRAGGMSRADFAQLVADDLDVGELEHGRD